MRAGQGAQSKLQAGGASLARGAQQQQRPQQQQQQQQLDQQLNNNHHHHHHQQSHQHHFQQHYQQQDEFEVVVVKQEAGESGGEESPVTWQSRQLLRKTIMNRRQAQGLGDIPAIAPSPGPVKHELTPQEIEKREKRKEQNRRAARKCRQKKKLMHCSVQDDYVKMIEDNQKLEKESTVLRAEVDSLKKELTQHLRSGQCRHSLDNARLLISPTTSSSLSAPLLTSVSSPVTYPSPSPPCVQAASSIVDHLKVSNEVYLQDFGQISPDQTFTDLDTLMNLRQVDLLECADIPQPNANDNFKTLTHQPPSPSPQPRCQSNPTSPATTNPDRHSVSSLASDWSTVSDQSPGFGLVPTDGGSPVLPRVGMGMQWTATSLSSTGECDPDAGAPHAFGLQAGTALGVPMECDLNDLEDDVFVYYG